MKILVVDDSRSLRKQVCETLKRNGYIDLLDADGPDDAVRILKENDVDLVITDTQMTADDSGPQLCKFIKAHYPKTKVILMSSSTNLLSEAQDNGIPANAFFNKLHGMPTLLKIVKNAITER